MALKIYPTHDVRLAGLLERSDKLRAKADRQRKKAPLTKKRSMALQETIAELAIVSEQLTALVEGRTRLALDVPTPSPTRAVPLPEPDDPKDLL